jgi:hypothetical protein
MGVTLTLPLAISSRKFSEMKWPKALGLQSAAREGKVLRLATELALRMALCRRVTISANSV